MERDGEGCGPCLGVGERERARESALAILCERFVTKGDGASRV
jgi:hypothetical protein